MMNLIDMLAAERPTKSTRYSQDGVKYRTICSDCNSGLLGARYDPELISMARNITGFVSSKLWLPPSLAMRIKPNRLCRSVVGHLLAHRVDSYREGDVISSLTDYFLDESANFPNDLRLYYWVYPYKDQVAITGAGLSQYLGNDFAVFMLLKFFPLSFLFVSQEPDTWKLPVRRLDLLLTNDIDDEKLITVDTAGLPARRWPEVPGENGLVMYGEGATMAIPRTERKNRG